MKYIILFLFIVPVVSANIVINEVYYNPINSETGGEAIELFNPTNETIDISGMIIKTKSSDEEAVLPTASIKAEGYYLITDKGWSENKDNPSWPNADYEEAITLSNSDAGIAIILNNTIIDAVGWGNQNNIPQDLFEVTPLDIVPEGYSIQRIKDTNNNKEDFVKSIPNLKNSNPAFDNIIRLSINLTNPYPKIINFTIEDDDNLTEGCQILPNPDLAKSVNIEAVVEDADKVWVKVKDEIYNLTFNNTWKGSFNMEFYDEAEEYVLELYAMRTYSKNNYTTNKNYTFNYLSLTAINIDGNDLNINLLQGEEKYIRGDKDMSTSNNITIKNIGNTKVDFMIKTENITSEERIFPLNNIKYSFDMIEWKNLSVNPQMSYENMDFGKNSLLPLTFFFESRNVEEGNYAQNIMVVALES